MIEDVIDFTFHREKCEDLRTSMSIVKLGGEIIDGPVEVVVGLIQDYRKELIIFVTMSD